MRPHRFSAKYADPILDDFNWKKRIVLSGSSSALTNYPVMFTIYSGEGVDSAGVIYLNNKSRKSDLSDIRFVDQSGVILPYWIESHITTSPWTVWVSVPVIPTTGTIISILVGNTTATSASSGTNTFSFFDDFAGASLDAAKWGVDSATGTRTFGNSYMNVSVTGNNAINSISAIGDTNNASVVTGAKYRVTSDYAEGGVRFGIKCSGTSVGVKLCTIFNSGSTRNITPLNEYVGWGNILQTYTLSTWYNIEIRHDYTSTFYYRCGLGSAWASFAANPSGTHIGVSVYNGSSQGSNPSTVDVDYVYQRKYQATEPAVSATNIIQENV